jgi:hypothetical protein
MSGNKEPSPSK